MVVGSSSLSLDLAFIGLPATGYPDWYAGLESLFIIANGVQPNFSAEEMKITALFCCYFKNIKEMYF